MGGRALKKYLMIFGLILGIAGFSFAQIPISLPDVTASPGESLLIPVTSGEVTAGDFVYFYQFGVYFDPEVVIAETPGYNYTGAFTPTVWWNSTVCNISYPDSILLGAYSFAAPLVGSGTLVNLMMQVPETATGSTDISFSYFMYSEGTPAVVTTNGSVTVITALPAIEDLVISVDGDDIYLDWGVITGATEYNVYREAVPYYTLITVWQTATTNSFVDENAMLDGPWFYIVTATN